MSPGGLGTALPAGLAGTLADVPPPEPAHLTILLPFAILLVAVTVTAVVLVLRRGRARGGPGGQP